MLMASWNMNRHGLRLKSIAGPPIDRLSPKIDQKIGDYRFLVSGSSKRIQSITVQCSER